MTDGTRASEAQQRQLDAMRAAGMPRAWPGRSVNPFLSCRGWSAVLEGLRKSLSARALPNY